MKLLRRWEESDESFSRYYFLLGKNYKKLEKYEDAYENIQKVIEINNRCGEEWYYDEA